MEIIKHGKTKFISTCDRCGCVFSYSIYELKGRWPLKTIHCPDCDEEVYHKHQADNSESAGAETSNECPLCGTPLIPDKSVVYTSNPPQFKEVCPKCGYSRFMGMTSVPVGGSLTGTPVTMEGSTVSGYASSPGSACFLEL